MRVLIAVSNPEVAESLSLFLEFDGHLTQTAYDARAAQEFCSEFQPTAAIVDVDMTLPDGESLSHVIREWADIHPGCLVGFASKSDAGSEGPSRFGDLDSLVVASGHAKRLSAIIDACEKQLGMETAYRGSFMQLEPHHGLPGTPELA